MSHENLWFYSIYIDNFLQMLDGNSILKWYIKMYNQTKYFPDNLTLYIYMYIPVQTKN